MNYRRLMTLLLGFCVLAGCGPLMGKHATSNSDYQAPTSPGSPARSPSSAPTTPAPSIPAPTASSSLDDVKFDFGYVLREFGTFDGKPDRAALFIVESSRGLLEISDVQGPGAAHDDVYVGTVERINSKIGFFRQSASPMSADDRNELLKKHGVASAVYLEHYDEPLCDDAEKEFTANGTILDVKVAVKFTFEAVAETGAKCFMRVTGGMVAH